MGRFSAYALAALLTTLASAPAASAQSQGYPYGGQQYGAGAATVTVAAQRTAVFLTTAAVWAAKTAARSGAILTASGAAVPLASARRARIATTRARRTATVRRAAVATATLATAKPAGPNYGNQYGRPAAYGSSPFAPPAYGAPSGGAPNTCDAYGPPANPVRRRLGAAPPAGNYPTDPYSYGQPAANSYGPSPYGATPPASNYPTDPYSYGQPAANSSAPSPYGPSPYGAAPGAPQQAQTNQSTQTGCNGSCTLGTYFYGVGVPTNTPYGGGNTQITPYNVGGLAWR